MTDQKKRSRAAGPSAGSTGSGQDLRQRAEARYAEAAPGTTEDGAVLSPEETRKTLHELRVHQIELELQNEELRRAQAELEASRARYFDLFDLAPVGYLTLSEKGLILEANLTAAALLGTERRALAGRPLSRFIPAEDQDTYYLYQKRLFADGRPHTCELRLLRQGAEPFHARLDAVLSREEGGAPICRCVVVDITERKQAEEALRESNARYELVLEGAGGGIWDWDVPNQRVHFSPRWKQMRGYAENEVSDSETEWTGNIHPEDAPRVMAAVREHFEGRTEVFEEEYRVRRKDGSYLWILDRGKAVRDAAGQVVRMAGSEINLTERKQIEAKLTQQLALNQTILNTTPGFLVLKDRNSVYVDVNLAFCQFLGKPREGIIGKTDLDLFPPQDAAMYIAGDSAVIETGSPESEDWLVSGEEQKRWLRVTKNAVRDADGKINGVLCSVTDITERKRAEEELRQRYAQLERWHHATVGREVRMIELKQEINSLCRAAGLPERYAAKTPAELTLPDSGPATTSNEQGEVS